MEYKWYRLYFHSVGGGEACEGPREFKSEEDARDAARIIAIDDYESFEGYLGVPDIGDIMDDMEKILSGQVSESWLKRFVDVLSKE